MKMETSVAMVLPSGDQFAKRSGEKEIMREDEEEEDEGVDDEDDNRKRSENNLERREGLSSQVKNSKERKRELETKIERATHKHTFSLAGESRAQNKNSKRVTCLLALELFSLFSSSNKDLQKEN
jgi:hypothetical protein